MTKKFTFRVCNKNSLNQILLIENNYLKLFNLNFLMNDINLSNKKTSGKIKKI